MPTTATHTHFSALPAHDKHSLTQLGWPTLADILNGFCLTHVGQQRWANATFYTSAPAITLHQQAVSHCQQWLERRDIPEFPTGVTLPLPPLITHPKLLTLGQALTAQQLGQLASNLHLQLGWYTHLRTLHKQAGQPAWPTTNDATHPFSLATKPVAQLSATLQQWFLPNGTVADTASPELARLRQQHRHNEDKLAATGQQLLATHAKQVQERLVTERNGRMVLPILANFKHQIKGMVQDSSTSGQTVYLEPDALIPLNNERQRLSSDIDHAIAAICQAASQQIAALLADLTALEAAIGQLDATLAAAQLAIALEAHPATVLAEPQHVDLKALRHPLLVWERAQQRQRGEVPEPVIANTLQLGSPHHPQTLVITGPNTGGKSVLLTALGLCAWMQRAGLHLPCEPDSGLSIFHAIGTVLGDAQNLAQNLSTFSGHIEQLAAWVQPHTDLSRTLLLIDEIASGTDPAEGAALAEAVLQHLHNHGAITVVTTHLGVLKRVAAQQTGFANASVLFDVDTLSPTYQLAVGLPGASHALTIAQRHGLPEEIIQHARTAASQQAPAAEALMATLGEQEQHLRTNEQTLSQRELALAEKEHQLAQVEASLHSKKHEFTQHIQRRLRHQLQQLEADVNDTRKRLRKTDDDGDFRHRERHAQRHKKRANTLAKQTETLASDLIESVKIDDLAIGMAVDSAQLGTRGTITALDIKKERLTLNCNGLTVTVPVSDVVPVVEYRQPKSKKPKKLDMLGRPIRSHHSSGGGSGDPPPTDRDPSDEFPTAECKLVGMRVQEALQATEAFMDEAVLGNHRVVAIIHGMGTGKLRQAVHQYLKQSPLVSTYGIAQAIHGGDGKTIVILK